MVVSFFSVEVVARMFVNDFGAQECHIDVRVDFGGENAFVPEHLLNSPQIGTAFEQMCGKRMAKRVRRNLFFDIGRGG